MTETRFQGDDVKCTVLFKGIEEPLTALIDARSRPAARGRRRGSGSIRNMFLSLKLATSATYLLSAFGFGCGARGFCFSAAIHVGEGSRSP